MTDELNQKTEDFLNTLTKSGQEAGYSVTREPYSVTLIYPDARLQGVTIGLNTQHISQDESPENLKIILEMVNQKESFSVHVDL